MPNEVKLLPCPLADELEAIRSGVDAFNPDARLAARSAFDAAEQVWKLVPKIIVALRSRPTTVVTDEVVERVAQALESADDAWFEIRPRDRVGTIWQSMARAAIASMPTVVTGEQPLQSVGVPASPSGHSRAEPEEVSALRASVPNAALLAENVRLRAVHGAALTVCNSAIDECRDDGQVFVAGSDLQTLNDALDAVEEADQ